MTRSSGVTASTNVRVPAIIRAVTTAAVLSVLAACSGANMPVVNQSHEAARYASRARSDYVQPGPPEDPWGPYVSEASTRFDVPQRWICEVMRVELGGKMFQNGHLITSWVGAMGLMQVMPDTYDELRSRYDLSDDAYDPHNNILAGTAYMREMYDIYGSPGFLAAYNAGPKRLDDYLSNTRPLPEETRRYVAMIGPYIMDSHPVSRSPAEDYAMNDLPVVIPAGLRYGRAVQVAQARPAAPGGASADGPGVRADRLPYAGAAACADPDGRWLSHHRVRIGGASGSFRRRRRRPSRCSAVARPPELGGAGRRFRQSGQAREAVGDAKHRVSSAGTSAVSTVRQGHGILYRARLTGMSRSAAVEACQKLTRSRTNCIVLSPDSQS